MRSGCSTVRPFKCADTYLPIWLSGPLDADLQRKIAAWNGLPTAIRKAPLGIDRQPELIDVRMDHKIRQILAIATSPCHFFSLSGPS